MITKKPRDNKGYYDIIVNDKNDKSFLITVGGNLDLYWLPQNRNDQNRIFEISKSDNNTEDITFTIFNLLFDAIIKVDDLYNTVLNENKDTITFISEDWPTEEANILKITRSEDTFKIEFIENTNRDVWSFPHRGCSICFCNSGSRVPRVEALFMRMFNHLAYENKSIKSGNL